MATNSNNGNESGGAVTTINGGFTFMPNKTTLKDFKIGKELGQGGGGTVVEATTARSTGTVYALKKVSKSEYLCTKHPKNVNELVREINVQKELDHENILRIHGWFQDDDNVYLVLEHAPGGDLSKKGIWKDDAARKYMWQLLLAVDYLHGRHTVHRDLKPQNLLVGENDILKVADFGLCYVGTDPQTEVVGTVPFMAPEMLRLGFGPESERSTSGYYTPVDMWDVGLQAFFMLTRELPFGLSTTDRDGRIELETDGETVLKNIRSTTT